ncbi:hypothetical protein ILUMI_18459 [Ignelater luminosus]|uniref:Uncharacterized protein n=1 Tax=Ignelater luminosus TaxID=2038154 RepID=A0A8K0G6D6_IGNLU|nr:hypothetical protein ILUMI_18459 [Ignelater luminosus]
MGSMGFEFKTDVPQEEQLNHQYPKNSKLGTTKEIYPRYQKDVGQPAEQLSKFRAETNVTLTTSKQKKKFDRLLAEQKPRKEIQPLEPKKVVHNLSKHYLDEAAQRVLAKRFNYAVAPTRILVLSRPKPADPKKISEFPKTVCLAFLCFSVLLRFGIGPEKPRQIVLARVGVGEDIETPFSAGRFSKLGEAGRHFDCSFNGLRKPVSSRRTLTTVLCPGSTFLTVPEMRLAEVSMESNVTRVI